MTVRRSNDADIPSAYTLVSPYWPLIRSAVSHNPRRIYENARYKDARRMGRGTAGFALLSESTMQSMRSGFHGYPAIKKDRYRRDRQQPTKGGQPGTTYVPCLDVNQSLAH